MLSFSEQCYSTTSGPAKSSRSSTKTTQRDNDNKDDDDDDDQSIENIDKVHQDDDFSTFTTEENISQRHFLPRCSYRVFSLFTVYPALDASDDEDYIFKPKAKSQIDEAWNPKARVGPLLPKTNRPAREGAKKTSVEKGLEAAAAKRAKQSVSQSLLYSIIKLRTGLIWHIINNHHVRIFIPNNLKLRFFSLMSLSLV